MTNNVVYYDNVKDAILAYNPEFTKILAPERVPQNPNIVKFINATKELGKKCGINIKGYFPDDIAQYQKKVQYLKKSKNSDALKNLIEIFTRYAQKGAIGEVLLKLKLNSEGEKLLKGINLKSLKNIHL